MKAIKVTLLLILVFIITVFVVSCGDLDKAELGELLNREYDPNGYTDASYQNYLNYYQQAQDVYTSESTTNYRVEAATVDLLKAIEDLVPIADFSALLKELEEEINPMLYTASSYQIYKTVYDSAVIVANNELSKQSVVNNAQRNLKMAKQSLVRKTDTSALAELIDKEKTFNREEYTYSSYQRYLDAIRFAKEILYDDSASESDVRLAENSVKQAQNSLAKLGDTMQLSAFIADLEFRYFDNNGKFAPEERYTAITLEVLRNEITSAKNAISMKDTSSLDIERLTERLQTAASGVVDKLALHEAILRMDSYALMRYKYTSDSFDAYILEITKAMMLSEKENPTVQEINAAVAAILKAENNLVRKSIVASGSSDFNLASYTIHCYDVQTGIGDYFENYVDFYAGIFDSLYMLGLSGNDKFTVKDGYVLTVRPKSLVIEFEQGIRNNMVTVMGIDFTMDEYAVVNVLGSPTEFSGDGVMANILYRDAMTGIECRMQFSGGLLFSIEFSCI